MDEVSNKSLAVLVLVAIVISVGGTILSLNKLGSIPGADLTGYALNPTGKASLSITQVASLLVETPSVVDFGGGRVNWTGTATYADLYSNCSNCETLNTFYNGTWTYARQNLTVRNDGNVVLNVTIQGQNYSQLFTKDGVCAGYGTVNNANTGAFEWKLVDFQSACGVSPAMTGWNDFINDTDGICNTTGLNMQANHNSFYVDIHVRVPEDVPAQCFNTELYSTVTFIGET